MRRLPTSAIDPERKVKTMKVSVPIGPSSVLGWLAAAGGLITSTVQSIEGSHALASGPGKWPAILGMASLVATNLGRQLQAAGLPKAAAIAGDVGELPAALQSLAREAQANVAKVQASPDGVDSASVPFSRADVDVAAAARRRAQAP